MKSFFLPTLLSCMCYTAAAQQVYDVNLIPKEMLSHANSVIREDVETVEVRDIDNTLVHVKRAITVLNKNGDENAGLYLFYDKDESIKYVKGGIYNELGAQVSKFSANDFSDEGYADGFSLFNSLRYKAYRPAVPQYPYTIVYDYELRSRQTLMLPDWEPQDNTEESVEKSTYTLSCRADFNIRYKHTGNAGVPAIGFNSDKEKTYTWQAVNLKALKYEPYSPPFITIAPRVQIAPEKFGYYGIHGTYTDWASLGKWIYDKLLIGRQTVSPATTAAIKTLTDNIADPKLKAKKIYEYVQQKTHYVSIQAGIGGYQPFSAADVDEQNYGDCKALVNYTQALLKTAGIESWYCVVKSGRERKVSMQKDFASMDQGDHIILCIPFKSDTTWADCTSQTYPFGYLGAFTDDRIVLACTPDGGKLLHTPRYTANDNEEIRKAAFTIGTDGQIAGEMTTTFSGVDYEYREGFVDESFSDQNKVLQRIYPINNLLIQNYTLSQAKTQMPSITEKMKLTAKDYASVADGKFYFMINPMDRITEGPAKALNRRNDMEINRGDTHIDEVTITVPTGYHLEKKPFDITIDKPFGKFAASLTQNGNQLIYKRSLQIIDGNYGKDVYSELVDFYQDVADADSYTVALSKN